MSDEVLTLVFTLLSATLFATVASAIAKWKRLDKNFWAVLGFILGPIGLLNLFAKNRRLEDEKPSYTLNLAFGIGAIIGLYLLLTKTEFGQLSADKANCDQLVSEVISISNEESSDAKILGIYEIETRSRTEKRLECGGVAVLSSSEKASIKFYYYREYDQWWVSYEYE